MWSINKSYHYVEWLEKNKKRHELSTVKLDPCLNKKELDPTSYFHNSLKVIKTEIANFRTSKPVSNVKRKNETINEEGLNLRI